jgi:hypothetical protein
LWLGSELLAPVLECLLWKAMNLAITPLIQVATLPRLMMRTPERLTLTLPRSMSARHFVLSICKSRERTDRDPDTRRKCARNGRLPFGRQISLFGHSNSLFRQKNSLFHCVGTFA